MGVTDPVKIEMGASSEKSFARLFAEEKPMHDLASLYRMWDGIASTIAAIHGESEEDKNRSGEARRNGAYACPESKRVAKGAPV